MARSKKSVHKIQMAEKEKLHSQALGRIRYLHRKKYLVCLKDLLGGTIKEMLETKVPRIINLRLSSGGGNARKRFMTLTRRSHPCTSKE